MKSKIFFLGIVLATFYTCNLSAAVVEDPGIGDVAGTLYQPISLIIQLVRAVSIICGAGLILGGILRYFEYRRNPVAVRSSMVIFMFIFGVSLVLVGMIPMKFV